MSNGDISKTNWQGVYNYLNKALHAINYCNSCASELPTDVCESLSDAEYSIKRCKEYMDKLYKLDKEN